MSRAGVRAWARRRDANEKSLLDTAAKCGYLVMRLGEFDALLCKKSTKQLLMIDCKVPTGKPTKKQAALVAAGWPLHYIASPTQLLALLGVPDWPVRGER